MYSLLFAQEECKLMNLVSIGTDNTPTTTTLIISEGTSVQHASVIKLVRQNVSALEEFGRVRFEIRPFETAGGTQTREIAILNEQQATLLFTFMKNTKIVKAFKIALVKAFYEMAQKQRQQQTNLALQIPQSLPEALRLAANLAEQKMQLEAKVKEDAPKVEYYDQLQDAPGEITFTRFAKLIGIQRKRLIDWLRANRYIYGVSNTPYQNRIEQGLLVLRNPEGKTHSDGTPVFAPYAHVTPKGAGTIYRRLLDEGIIKRNDQLELSFS